MVSKINGIVIKTFDAGESGKRIIIITREHGKMLLSVRGAKNVKGKTMSATQLFSYSEFTYYEGKGFFSVTQADIIESFYGICSDVDRLAYGAYILELTERTSFEELEDEGMFELVIRTLLLLSKGVISPRLITIVFIIRLLKEGGFIGEIESCHKCGQNITDGAYFEQESGEMVCESCLIDEELFIGKGAVKAVNFIINSDMSKIFRFNVSDDVLSQLWCFADELRREYLGENYKTLKYLNNMQNYY